MIQVESEGQFYKHTIVTYVRSHEETGRRCGVYRVKPDCSVWGDRHLAQRIGGS